jgi:hypothetical protein
MTFAVIIEQGYDGESVLDMIPFEHGFERPVGWKAVRP